MGKVNISDTIKPVNYNDLPPEFHNCDKVFGLKTYLVNRYLCFILYPATIYYIFLLIFGKVPRSTLLFVFLHGYATGLGTTVGAHRYWSHRAFKARMPLQILLMLLQTAAFQYSIFKWCRDHRLHHKYTDTNADPHNATRGFWFSHMNWLMLPTHPELKQKLKSIDMSDLATDPVVRFQSKYYWELFALLFFVIPIALCKLIFPAMSYWHIFILNWSRYCASLHITFLVNSVAHKWGNKPYDKYVSSTESKLVSILTVGEGWHNYHHAFPWDYKASEFGYKYNMSTVFIDFFAWIGWAYDLKYVSKQHVITRINRTGDGSHFLHNKITDFTAEKEETLGVVSSRGCWGWGDKQIRKEDVDITKVVYPGNSRQE